MSYQFYDAEEEKRYEKQKHSEFAELTVFDEAKIELLEIGEQMEAESNHFIVERLTNSYNVYSEIGIQKGEFIFSSAEEVIKFLRNN